MYAESFVTQHNISIYLSIYSFSFHMVLRVLCHARSAVLLTCDFSRFIAEILCKSSSRPSPTLGCKRAQHGVVPFPNRWAPLESVQLLSEADYGSRKPSTPSGTNGSEVPPTRKTPLLPHSDEDHIIDFWHPEPVEIYICTIGTLRCLADQGWNTHQDEYL